MKRTILAPGHELLSYRIHEVTRNKIIIMLHNKKYFSFFAFFAQGLKNFSIYWS